MIIKPCPFCGSTKRPGINSYLHDTWVECVDCEARGPSVSITDTPGDVVEAWFRWNTRPTWPEDNDA